MPAEKKKKDTKNIQAKKRKRVNRLKMMIVAGAVILLFTSVFLNAILVIKVLHLENQIEHLYSEVPVSYMQNPLDL
ncbi:MAG: hypothetical protein NC300_01370 [Bacteroidales bacterium]|nr:hypothetical protein [Clostridium sp.]MCM1202775.1 hypothetical protein [Bacteroidales bacterium]